MNISNKSANSLDEALVLIGDFMRVNGLQSENILQMLEIGIFAAIELGTLSEDARCFHIISAKDGANAVKTIENHSLRHSISAEIILSLLDTGSFAYSVLGRFPPKPGNATENPVE